jgi:NAD(P)-dependent dehydrogenase (short-subunit alcohol dehydrogenase family)
MELSGKVVLVTGASRGIGRATAEALVARGATVAAAASTTDALGDLGAASTHAFDLSDPANAAALAEEVEQAHGRVDVLVNNAGTRVDQLITHVDLEDLDRSFQVNALSPYVLAGRLASGMAERGEGVVVNLVAPVVSPGRRGMGPYASSKAALESLTNTLRQEVGGKGVAVFGFDPGWVKTDLAPDGKEEPAAVAERLVAHIEAGKGSKTPLS